MSDPEIFWPPRNKVPFPACPNIEVIVTEICDLDEACTASSDVVLVAEKGGIATLLTAAPDARVLTRQLYDSKLHFFYGAQGSSSPLFGGGHWLKLTGMAAFWVQGELIHPDYGLNRTWTTRLPGYQTT